MPMPTGRAARFTASDRLRFLDEIRPPHRERFVAAGQTLEIASGDILLHRGAQGGQLYLVETGSFEVVDTRSQPEIVLDVIEAGAMVGEQTFLDDAPHGADVRAIEPSSVRVWTHADLLSLFDDEPTLAADVYRAFARTLNHRYRAMSSAWASGAFLSGRGTPLRQDVARQARDHAAEILYSWVDADERLRIDGTDRRGRTLIQAGLDHLLGDVTRWLTALPELEQRQTAGTMLSRELRPHLSRSTTGERLLDFLGQAAGDPRLLAHIIRGEPDGTDTFGHLLDELLLALPTFAAIRARATRLVEVGRALLQGEQPTDLLILNPNCGAVLVGLMMPMAVAGGTIRVVDGNQSVLGLVDAGLQRRPPEIALSFEQADLAAIAMGQIDLTLQPHDTIVLDGILDHLPDLLAVSFVTWCTRQLAPGGTLLCSGLSHASDAMATDHVFGWPLVRRVPASLARLLDTVPGLRAEVMSGDHIGVVVRAEMA